MFEKRKTDRQTNGQTSRRATDIQRHEKMNSWTVININIGQTYKRIRVGVKTNKLAERQAKN